MSKSPHLSAPIKISLSDLTAAAFNSDSEQLSAHKTIQKQQQQDQQQQQQQQLPASAPLAANVTAISPNGSTPKGGGGSSSNQTGRDGSSQLLVVTDLPEQLTPVSAPTSTTTAGKQAARNGNFPGATNRPPGSGVDDAGGSNAKTVRSHSSFQPSARSAPWPPAGNPQGSNGARGAQVRAKSNNVLYILAGTSIMLVMLAIVLIVLTLMHK